MPDLLNRQGVRLVRGSFWRWSIALALALVAGSSCTAGDESVAESGNWKELRILQLHERAIESGLDAQARALEDGHVAFSEYESAVLDALACMEAAGLMVEGPELMPNIRQLAYVYGGARTQAESLEENDVATECEDEHMTMVSEAYIVQIEPTASELEEIRMAYQQCLADGGIEVHEQASFDEMDSHAFVPGPGMECAMHYSQTMGFNTVGSG